MIPPWMAETYRRAREFEIAMEKVNAILGSTVTPAWVEAEVLQRTGTATVPVPGDGYADRYLRTMYPEEAAGSVLAAIMAGELPKERPTVPMADVLAMVCGLHKSPRRLEADRFGEFARGYDAALADAIELLEGLK